MSKQRARVAIVQASLRQYRVPFYEHLRTLVSADGLDLVLIHGNPSGSEAKKGDARTLPWSTTIEDKEIRLGSRSVYWQPCLSLLQDADLVIVEQASKLLLNYLLFAQQAVGRRRLAFWGHGKNLQAHRASALGEFIKRQMSRKVHWWFAYNDFSASIVQSLGYPAERITSVQNAIDTRHLVALREHLSEGEVDEVRQELGLQGSNVCIFSGGLYSDKRLDFLLAACKLIRERVPDFEMIFVGGGPAFDWLKEQARDESWIHAVGPKFDEEKVPYFAVSKLFLLPGLVGLAILDAFALQTPLITTAVPFHSPEVAYLQSGTNGVMVEDFEDPSRYAEVVVSLLEDDTTRERLMQGCKRSAGVYTVENMAERFADGVSKALVAPPLRGYP